MITNLWRSEVGTAAAEYALMPSLIAVVILDASQQGGGGSCPELPEQAEDGPPTPASTRR